MAYTTINKSSEHFNTKLYTGNAGTNAITGVGFQPDCVWIKPRNSSSYGTKIWDSVRGVTNFIETTGNAAEGTGLSGVDSFDTDGFTVGSYAGSNGSGLNLVSWNWKANGANSSNTDGSITSTVSANTTNGFSIVKWTGTGANATIGHGLGAVPKMIIAKRLSNTEDWTIYHTSLGATKKIDLNNTGAESTVPNIWNNTTPTNSFFYVGDHGRVNASGDTYIAYCFAEKTGYSKFGSYTGNGNVDGTFVYTGFKPAFVMSKRTDATDGWRMMDATRSSYNPAQHRLLADTSGAEVVASSQDKDFLSNGFKIRNSDSGYNGSGASYIYMAFAEAPLVGSNNVPCTAR